MTQPHQTFTAPVSSVAALDLGDGRRLSVTAEAGQPLYGEPRIALSLTHPAHRSRIDLSLGDGSAAHLVTAVSGGRTATWPADMVKTTPSTRPDWSVADAALTLNGTEVMPDFNPEDERTSEPPGNIISLSGAFRADLLARLETALTDLDFLIGVHVAEQAAYAALPPFHVHREDDIIFVSDAHRHCLVATDESGTMALAQVTETRVRAESRELRSHHYREVLHFLPEIGGSLTLVRVDSQAWIDGQSDNVTIDAEITLCTEQDRLAFISALLAVIPPDTARHEKPADHIWSTR